MVYKPENQSSQLHKTHKNLDRGVDLCPNPRTVWGRDRKITGFLSISLTLVKMRVHISGTNSDVLSAF